MPALHILSLALAAACLAGINLYLTAFLAGLAGRLGWLPVEGDHAVIGFLAHPAVMTVAALLYLLEAIVDKIPAVDSLWDALHTVIRPAGAVMLALQIMGNADPAYQALAGVLAGIAGLTTHLAKLSTRLLINNSPGPLANILTSIGEDLLVAGLFILTVHRPLEGAIVCLTLIAVLWILFPRMFRVARASLFLMWKKVRLPAGLAADRVKLPAKISADQDMLMHGELPGPCTVAWAVRCLTGRTRRFPALSPNQFGHLISVKEHPEALVFIGRRWFRHRPARITLTDGEVQHESGFLSEDVVIYNKSERRQIVLRFTRADEALAVHIADELRGRRRHQQPEARPEPAASPVPVPPPEPQAEPAPSPPPAAAPAPQPEPGPAVDLSVSENTTPNLIRECPPVAEPQPVAFHEPSPTLEPVPITPFPAAPDGVSVPAMADTPAVADLPAMADVPPMPSLHPVPAPRD